MPLKREWYEHCECTSKCRSSSCVTALNKLITTATTHQVKEYICTNCPSAVRRSDDSGRYPIHVAASCGKHDLLEWFLTILHCDPNVRDDESGWTALHRAIFYGRLRCALLLIEHSADMWIRDKEGFTAMDIAMEDCAPWVRYLTPSRLTYFMPSALSGGDPSEVYTWGANDNFTLGQGNPKGRKLPEPIDFFVKRRIYIKQVSMATFHSIFVTVSGTAYACGHGEGGRLGTGHQEVCLEPHPVVVASGVSIVMAAAGRNHSAFTNDIGQLLVCGMNKHHALGIHSQSDRELTPVRVSGPLRTLRVVGCAVGMCHTVVWTENGAVYTFGTNAGQLGHSKSDLHVSQPRQVSGVYKEDESITCVHACDSATVIATKLGSVYLLHNYVCRRIVSKQLDIEKIQVGGGRLDSNALSKVDPQLVVINDKLKEESLHVLMRKSSGDLLAWSKGHGSLDRCKFGLSHPLLFKDIALCGQGHTVLLTTNKGKAFLAKYGNWRPAKPARRSSQAALKYAPNSYESCLDMLDSDAVQEFKLEQVSCVFRAHTGAIGPKGTSGSVLQCEPRNFLTDVPVVNDGTMCEDMRKLWDDVSDHNVHDVILTAADTKGNKLLSLPCHKFVLASRSDYLRKILVPQECANNGDRVVKDTVLEEDTNPQISELVVQNCDPNVLRNVLEYAYCGFCKLFHEGYKLPGLAKGTDSTKIAVRYPEFASHSPVFNNNCEEEDEAIKDRTISAFAVYQKSKKRSGKSKVEKLTPQGKRTVLSEFKVALEKLGLSKAAYFDRVTVLNGIVHVTGDRPLRKPATTVFSRHKFRNFCDVELECTDRVIVHAHKCMLVARVEFFRSMLLSAWAESAGGPIKVPIPSDVFTYVLDFVYSDSSTVLSNSLSPELLCEVMAAADQLLLDRLKEIAEAQVASLLTLKNLSSIIEFASIFHCEQLKRACEQFVCQHLSALLHTPYFYAIDGEILEQVEGPYRENIDGVYRRIITPSSAAPNVSHIPLEGDLELSSGEHVLKSSGEDGGRTSPQKAKSSGRKSSKKSGSRRDLFGITLSQVLDRKEEEVDYVVERIASRRRTSSSMSLPEEPEEPMEDIVPTVHEDQMDGHTVRVEKSVSIPLTQSATKKSTVRPVSNLKDIMAAEEKLRHYETVPSNVSSKLPQRFTDKPQPWGNMTPTSPIQPQIGDTVGSKPVAKLPSVKPTPLGSSGTPISVKPKKLSQKQRKRLEQEAAQAKEEYKMEAVAASPVNAWGKPESPPTASPAKSFWDVMKEQAGSPNPVHQPIKASSPTQHQSESPWQKSVRLSPTSAPSSGFRDIVQHEIRQVEQTERQRNKPMHLIQLEDQAMAELKSHYEKTIPMVDGQFFTVDRIRDAPVSE